MLAEAVLQENAVTRRQHPRRLVGRDRDSGEHRPVEMLQPVRQRCEASRIGDIDILMRPADPLFANVAQQVAASCPIEPAGSIFA